MDSLIPALDSNQPVFGDNNAVLHLLSTVPEQQALLRLKTLISGQLETHCEVTLKTGKELKHFWTLRYMHYIFVENSLAVKSLKENILTPY